MREEEELDSDTEEILRETTLLVLRLFYARAITQLQGMEQELELLRNAPPSPMLAPESEDPRDKHRNAEESDWKLDIPLAGGPDGKGPLMDAQGKVSSPTSNFSEHFQSCIPASSTVYNSAIRCWGASTSTGSSFWTRTSITNHVYRRILGDRASTREYNHRWRVRNPFVFCSSLLINVLQTRFTGGTDIF
jgi:hypothetical protein